MTQPLNDFIYAQIYNFYEALGSRKLSRGIVTVDDEGVHRCLIEADNGDGTRTVYEVIVKPSIDTKDDYWLNYLAQVDGRRAVIDGTHYVIGSEPTEAERRNRSGCLGMSGREFHIRFKDTDEVVVTHNLWYQGVIPPKHRAVYPDNAEFVSGGMVTLADGTRCWNPSGKVNACLDVSAMTE